jgi:sugar diacid utilization regulator
MWVVGSHLWQVVDETSAQVAAAYHATELRQVRADEQRRATLWEGLLSGRATEHAFALEASRMLDLALDGPLVIAAVHHPEPESNFADGIAQRLQARGVTSTWQRRADCQVGFLQLTTSDLEPSLSVLRDWPGVAVGLSTVAPGLAHTDVAFREAMLALRTVAPDSPEVATYQERLPDALLLSSPEVAARLVDVWLGPLFGLPDREHIALLETMEIWVACAGSASRTALRVPCHRNTVINRVRRVAEVTGHALAEGPPPMELALALRAWRLTRND